MSDAEQLYSSQQVAKQLGLSAAMVRRYAAAFEEITGQKIKMIGRDGRQYTIAQLQTMLQAKALVEQHPRLTVADALKIALGLSSELEISEHVVSPQIGSQALTEAFSEALKQTLLPELQELRAEIAALRLEARERQALPDVTANAGDDLRDDSKRDHSEDGVLVRFARRIEGLLRWHRAN